MAEPKQADASKKERAKAWVEKYDVDGAPPEVRARAKELRAKYKLDAPVAPEKAAPKPEGFFSGLASGLGNALGGAGEAIAGAVRAVPGVLKDTAMNLAQGVTYDHADDIGASIAGALAARDVPLATAGRAVDAPLDTKRNLARQAAARQSAEQMVRGEYAQNEQNRGLAGKGVHLLGNLAPGMIAGSGLAAAGGALAAPAAGGISVGRAALPIAERLPGIVRGGLGVLGDMGLVGAESAAMMHGRNPDATAAEYGEAMGPAMLTGGALSAGLRGLGAAARGIAARKSLPTNPEAPVSSTSVLYSGSQTAVDVRNKALLAGEFENVLGIPGAEGAPFSRAGWAPPPPRSAAEKAAGLPKTAGDFLQEAADQAKVVGGGVDDPLASNAARLAAEDVAPDAARLLRENRTLARNAEAKANKAFELDPDNNLPSVDMSWVDEHLDKWRLEMTQGDKVVNEPLRDAFAKLEGWSARARQKPEAKGWEGGPEPGHPLYDATKASGKLVEEPVGPPMASLKDLETLIQLVRDTTENVSGKTGPKSTVRGRVANDTYDKLLDLRRQMAPGWAKRKDMAAADIQAKEDMAKAAGFDINNPTALRNKLADSIASAPSEAGGQTGLEDLMAEIRYAKKLPSLIREAEKAHPTGAVDEALAKAEQNAALADEIMARANVAKSLGAFRAHVAENDMRTAGLEAVKNRLQVASRASRAAAYQKLVPGEGRKAAARAISLSPGVLQTLPSRQEENR